MYDAVCINYPIDQLIKVPYDWIRFIRYSHCLHDKRIKTIYRHFGILTIQHTDVITKRNSLQCKVPREFSISILNHLCSPFLCLRSHMILHPVVVLFVTDYITHQGVKFTQFLCKTELYNIYFRLFDIFKIFSLFVSHECEIIQIQAYLFGFTIITGCHIAICQD